ncbi:MAG: hypothetical protein IPI46_12775 [Bacteroidetes bacterium]|nr:hypothetical protein [Bacteroidota bacterium]
MEYKQYCKKIVLKEQTIQSSSLRRGFLMNGACVTTFIHELNPLRSLWLRNTESISVVVQFNWTTTDIASALYNQF